MRGRRGWWWLACAALLVTPGCAHSEDEWQAQLRTVADLKAKLDAEQARAKAARVALDDVKVRTEGLEQQLRAAGLEEGRLAANLEAQARAMEEQRRRGEQLDAARRRVELLRARLAPLAKQGLAVAIRRNRIVLQLPGDALFEAGRETLKREGREMLLRVAEVLRAEPTLSSRDYQVAGHVDAPPKGSRLQDAFGSSLIRAREVLSFLLETSGKGGGLSPDRWSAAGHGAADPVRSNDTPEGRQVNRRCEIVLLPAMEEALDLRGLAP